MNPVIRFLLWVGFVSIGRKSTVCDIDPATGEWRYRYPETVIWPFSAPPWHVFWVHFRYGGSFPRFYVFRNQRGVIKWVPGRLLPVRWGFGVCGFEFGDRGHAYSYAKGNRP